MAFSDYMLRRQGLKNGTREKDAPKERKPLPKISEKKKAALGDKKFPSKKNGGRSEKMRGVISALRPLYDKFLKTRPDCEIVSPVCTGEAVCVHHVEGRGIKVILDDTKWKASCAACNGYVESNDAEARKNGNKVSRHKKY